MFLKEKKSEAFGNFPQFKDLVKNLLKVIIIFS